MSASNGTELNFSAIGSALLRKLWLISTVSALVGAGTYAALGTVTPLYTSRAAVLIESRESPITRARDAGGSADAVTLQFDELAVQSQVEVIRSPDNINRVIDKLALDRSGELDQARRSGFVDLVLTLLGWKQEPAGATIRQRVLDSFEEHLTVFSLGKSRVIGVEFSAADPKRAADIANALVASYVDAQRDAKRQSTLDATKWLQAEIDRLRGAVAAAEEKVETYRSDSDLFRSGDADSTLSTQQLTELNMELARVRSARSEAEAKASLVRGILDSGGAIETSPEVLASPLIQRLRERQIALRSEIADLTTTLLPNHPRVRAVQKQLDALEGQIRSEVRKVLVSLETAAKISAAREASVAVSIKDQKTTVAKSSGEGVELRALEREARAQRDLLESFLARYREAAARADADYLPIDSRVIATAAPASDPSYPKKGVLSLIAALATFLLGSAVVVLRAMNGGGAWRPIAVPGVEGVATVAPVARVPSKGAADVLPAVAGGAGPEPMVEENEAIAAIAGLIGENGLSTVLFAGATGEEEVGRLAVSVARRGPAAGWNPLILDIGVQSSLDGVAVSPGLGELLSGRASFGEVIRRDIQPGVDAIPNGDTSLDPPLSRLTLVGGALNQSYDKVVAVAKRIADWPAAHLHADLVVLLCGQSMPAETRQSLYESVLEKGATSALVVRVDDAPDRDAREAA